MRAGKLPPGGGAAAGGERGVERVDQARPTEQQRERRQQPELAEIVAPALNDVEQMRPAIDAVHGIRT